MAAPADAVWARISTPQGINYELAPWLRMTMPRPLEGRTLDDVELGRPLGRSWLLLFGFLPFDYDDLMIGERDRGRRFLETSSTLTMARWNHERVLIPRDRGCEVTDKLCFQPRGLFARSRTVRRAMRSIVTAIFRHRHRRLTDYFGNV